MQNYSGCNGNYINFYAKLVPKIIMTELFKKHCFWFLLIEGKIVPKTWAYWVFEDYKFLATHKKVGKPNIKISRKAGHIFTENTYYGTFVLCMGQIIDCQSYW